MFVQFPAIYVMTGLVLACAIAACKKMHIAFFIKYTILIVDSLYNLDLLDWIGHSEHTIPLSLTP